MDQEVITQTPTVEVIIRQTVTDQSGRILHLPAAATLRLFVRKVHRVQEVVAVGQVVDPVLVAAVEVPEVALAEEINLIVTILHNKEEHDLRIILNFDSSFFLAAGEKMIIREAI